MTHSFFGKKYFAGVSHGGSQVYSFFPRNLSRGFHGFVAHSFLSRVCVFVTHSVFKEIFREGFAGVSRVCDTFIFQKERKNFTGASHVGNTFVHKSEKKNIFSWVSPGICGSVTLSIKLGFHSIFVQEVTSI